MNSAARLILSCFAARARAVPRRSRQPAPVADAAASQASAHDAAVPAVQG